VSAARLGLLGRLDERRLKLLFGAFFLALAVPAAVLVVQAYGQLKWEALRSMQVAAQELAERIDGALRMATATEEARSFGDYSFLVVTGDESANFVQRSPLSTFPVTSALPGVIGYFQVDADGQLSTPLLPETGIDADRYGIGAEERAARAALVAQLRDVLAENRLVRSVRDEPVAGNVPASPTASSRPSDEVSAANDGAAKTEQRAGSRSAEPFSGAAGPAAVPARLGGQGVEERDADEAVAEPRSLDDAAAAQAAFDRLVTDAASSARNVRARAVATAANEAAPSARTDLGGEASREASSGVAEARTFERQKRVEQTLVPEAALAREQEAKRDGAAATATTGLRIRTFESEVDPFELGVLDTGQLVLFRNAWRDGRRYVQGALVDQTRFLQGVLEVPYRASNLAPLVDLGVSFQGRALATFSATGAARYSASVPRDLVGAPLYRARLSPPFGELAIELDVSSLPAAPGTGLLVWVSVALAVVLCGGFLLMYRFAAGQLKLVRQQRDFVSAVSHELKTPLTSIRMYGEMLKAGWVDEAKRATYYDYIHGESERLSRLIDNVLQLARLTRSTQHFDMQPHSATELLDMVRSKVGTQVERAGFSLRLHNEAPAAATLTVDADSFAQIFINLVDNALKFAASAAEKVVEIGCKRERDGTVLFTVRDFGPGVPKAQMKKIFELFYRAESELTRETVGTGIGLSLVLELATAMGGRVDVRNCEPGAEFRLHFGTG